ncbi:MAG: bifunctional chorismate mutase/prephenate dehydrogenase [Woeseiaceae bacterium]|nr:bifunctional chorismate mutase/prephenate dehydrogenase [Woeseiaceae bacterium]
MTLEDLRTELNDVDTRIIDLIAERQRIIGDIGRQKMDSGRGTRDFEREKAVLGNARAHASAAGVDPDLAEQVLTALIRASLESQERERVAAAGAGDGRRALVIGGAGKMGRWFVEFFRSQGFDTAIADRAAPSGDDAYASWQEAGLDFDIIVVATPLAVSAGILLELAAARPEALIFDIGSLKTPLREGLAALRDAGCRVTSLHPMFGPDTRLLSGRHLIVVDVGVPEATARARELFAATMVEQLEMDIDDHDRLIAYVLGLSHALNVVFFTALAESGEAAPKLARMSSTTFDAQLLVSSAVARDNPRLYFEIQKLNDYGSETLDALCESAERVRRTVMDNDEDGFVRLMERGRDYLATRG